MAGGRHWWSREDGQTEGSASVALAAVRVVRWWFSLLSLLMAQSTCPQQVGPSVSGATLAEMDKLLKDEEVERLIDASLAARRNAYCPYSKFQVGAALLTKDGSIITGCNVENVSYGLTVCAERTAVYRAVAEGQRKFRAIAITAEMGNRFVGPCGACRQTLVEFGLDWEVYLATPDKRYMKTTVSKLIPDSFSPEWVTLGERQDG